MVSKMGRGALRVRLESLVMLLLIQVCVAPIPPQVAYFNSLRERCEDADCTRRVYMCQSDQISQAYNPKLMEFKKDCVDNHADQDPVTCAHLQFGDYNSDGTLRSEVLQEHFEAAFSKDPQLLQSLASRIELCDKNFPAQVFLDCVLEGCATN
ncbi:uncharacterized protein LOC135222608 [Macrobrachium nipponense]|uniref:uncharacterized protein LOC135222608 n=1 Tax=Macrobrachium nipponense TaxID=159736 RepID=UPI0030C8A1DA